MTTGRINQIAFLHTQQRTLSAELAIEPRHKPCQRKPLQTGPSRLARTQSASDGVFLVSSCVKTTESRLERSLHVCAGNTRPTNLFATSFNRFPSTSTHTLTTLEPYSEKQVFKDPVTGHKQTTLRGQQAIRSIVADASRVERDRQIRLDLTGSSQRSTKRF